MRYQVKKTNNACVGTCNPINRGAGLMPGAGTNFERTCSVVGLCGKKTLTFFVGGREMEKKILDAMKKAGKPVRPGDVAKMIGADSKEVSKVISELKKKGKVVSPKRCFYSVT